MVPGNISGPINAGRTGVVAKIVIKQEPSPADITKDFDQTRDQILDQRRGEAFQVFASGIIDDYKKHRRVLFNGKTRNPQLPGE
jgi:peptidyl-prolyl cis-trans isomerase D